MRITPVLLLATLVACTESPGGPDNDATVATLHAGSAQTAFTSTAVPIRPAVLVTSRGEAVAGVTVTFRVLDGGGIVQGATQVTDADGIARVDAWILGSAGPQSLEAVIDEAVGSPVRFAATAVHTVPAIVEVLRGTGLQDTVGWPVDETPRLRVIDAQGRPAAGIPVTWTTVSGGGGYRYADIVTDQHGEAGVAKWILGTGAGLNVITASVDCPSCESVSFTAVGLAGAVYSMVITAGDLQRVAPGAAVSVRPTVKLRDVFQNAASGRLVTFTVMQGDGSVSGATVMTDANGSASVGEWILGAGENLLRAEAEGYSVLFRATGAE